MAYDGNPADHVKPDVFNLEGLAAWLETQDGATEYDFNNCDGLCLLDQYLTSCGHEGSYAKLSRTKTGPFSNIGNLACANPWTYAAALDRCRTLLAEGQQ